MTSSKRPPANPGPDRYALLSVFNKKGILSLARGLHETGFRILSTGGTAAFASRIAAF